MSNIKILKGRKLLDFKSFVFPGGEISVKLKHDNYNFLYENADCSIVARLHNANDIMELIMVKDAVGRLNHIPKVPQINLLMPYVPYSRQDRVCDKGESFSLKAFCDIINSLNFNRVTICDPHSEVTPALLNNVKVISQFDLINKNLELTKRIRNTVLVSPDAGANKKTSEIAKYLEHSSFVRADKLRDLTNGNILETIVYCDNFKGKDVLVCDDICDGGRTFIELAKVCKTKNCGKFILYVTHGIFSKGTAILFNSGIDEIWTTNSFEWRLIPSEMAFHERVKVLNLEERFTGLL